VLILPRMFRRLLFLFLLAAVTAPLHAQLRVQVNIPRRLYMVYEPVIATVTITNLAGRDLELRDDGSTQWFGFQIQSGDDRLVSPRNLDYRLDPLLVPAGQTVKRSVNLLELFPITEFGLYRIKASIHSAELSRYFTSAPDNIEISEGRLLWQQTVGVPEGNPGAGSNRVYSLLSFRQPKDNVIYVRVADEDNGVVHCTLPLGRILYANEPFVELDRDNILHVLQIIGPKTWAYSKVGVNGEWLGQKTLVETKSRPKLGKAETGVVSVRGGREEVPVVVDASQGPAPKISDRPPGMPK